MGTNANADASAIGNAKGKGGGVWGCEVLYAGDGTEYAGYTNR